MNHQEWPEKVNNTIVVKYATSGQLIEEDGGRELTVR
jgi:hypothetical protein